jgi:hypothetical protein
MLCRFRASQRTPCASDWFTMRLHARRATMVHDRVSRENGMLHELISNVSQRSHAGAPSLHTHD